MPLGKRYGYYLSRSPTTLASFLNGRALGLVGCEEIPLFFCGDRESFFDLIIVSVAGRRSSDSNGAVWAGGDP
jgi:hypothetical protein